MRTVISLGGHPKPAISGEVSTDSGEAKTGHHGGSVHRLGSGPTAGPCATEAKYVDFAGLAAKKKDSQKQLRDTMRRIQEALFGDPERLDRDSWLARLSDLVLDGIRLPAASGIDLGEWRRAM